MGTSDMTWPPQRKDIPPAFTVGEEVSIHAWWTHPKGQRVLCRIVEANPGKTDYWSDACYSPPQYTVQPLTGNTHYRWVNEYFIDSPRAMRAPEGYTGIE